MQTSEEDALGVYKNLIAHGTPVDSRHPGVENLTELEKDLLAGFEAKGEDLLSPPESDLNDKLRNLIVKGSPLDLTHAGSAHLAPFEVERFRELQRAKESRDLSDFEKRELSGMQERLRSGSAIDENHPGTENLTPLQ